MKRFLMMAVAIAMMFMATATMTGCGIFSADNGWRGYVAATGELANLAETYQASYEMASPTAQERWREQIDPLFIQAENALKAWRTALDLATDPSTAQEMFIRLRALILKALIEIEEG